MLFNDSSRRAWFSTYSGGTQTHTVELLLPFDATADYHEYAIAGRAASRARRCTSTSNAWFPSWLAGESPASDQSTLVDGITYSAQ